MRLLFLLLCYFCLLVSVEVLTVPLSIHQATTTIRHVINRAVIPTAAVDSRPNATTDQRK